MLFANQMKGGFSPVDPPPANYLWRNDFAYAELLCLRPDLLQVNQGVEGELCHGGAVNGTLGGCDETRLRTAAGIILDWPTIVEQGPGYCRGPLNEKEEKD